MSAPLAGLEAYGIPEPPLHRARRALGTLVLAAAAAGSVVASGSFVWGSARTLHGDVLPRLLALLALVVAVRGLRGGPEAGLFGRGPSRPRGARLAALAEAALVLAAVSAFLREAWRVAAALASPWGPPP